ncbi:MAG: hypothetical protein IT458_06680 [Planctomycetes bacterium]|nr:hypothetical protein [Planctomycetota bacterium]
MSRSGPTLHLLPLLASLALGACSSGVGNSAPRFQEIPKQTVGSGATLTMDLAGYVVDREGQTLSWSVVSGGGSFAGSTYSNTFATLGTYTVQVQATDAMGKSSVAPITVKVGAANLAALQADSGLKLMDTDTLTVLPVASSGFAETFRAALPCGQLVYERNIGGQYDLYVYDPNTRTTTRLGDSDSADERYAAATSDGKVVFTSGTASDTDLFVFNPATSFTRTISNGLGQHDRNAIVNATDLVFYERGVAGQSDIYYYDPGEDESYPVATAATAETLRGALPNGAVVLSRIGAGGEQDLYCFRVATGLAEIGADLSATVQAQTKTYAAHTSDSMVVFEVTAAASIDLYMWNPATGQSRALATSASDERWVAVTAGNGVVYKIVISAGNDDLALYTWAGNASATIANSADDEEYQGSTSAGDVVYSVDTGAGGVDLHFYDVSVPASAAIATAGSDDYLFHAVLPNDKVVYGVGGATPAVSLYTPGGASATVASGNGAAFAGASLGGDFCYTQTASSQTDLYLWDESASATVPISTTAGNDAFLAGLSGGARVLFTRVPAGQGNAEVFVWTAAGSTETRATNSTNGHTLVTVYTANCP